MSKDFLIFSDLHAHNFSYKAKSVVADGCPSMLNSRLVDTLNVLDEIREYALRNNISTVVFAGDLFHSRKSVEIDVRHTISNKIIRFSEDGITLLMIPGNHDMGDRYGSLHSLHGLHKIHNIHVFDTVAPHVFTDASGNTFILVPYSESLEATKMAYAEAEFKASTLPGPVFLIGHTGVSGAKVGGDFVLESESDLTVSDLPSGFTACFFGHFHEHQELKSGSWYVGATHQHNWGDSNGKRGFLHVSTESKLAVKRVETSAPKFIKMTSDCILEVRPCDFVKVISPVHIDKEALSKDLPGIDFELVVDKKDEVRSEVTFDSLGDKEVLKTWVESNPDEEVNSSDLLSVGVLLMDGSYG